MTDSVTITDLSGGLGLVPSVELMRDDGAGKVVRFQAFAQPGRDVDATTAWLTLQADILFTTTRPGLDGHMAPLKQARRA